MTHRGSMCDPFTLRPPDDHHFMPFVTFQKGEVFFDPARQSFFMVTGDPGWEYPVDDDYSSTSAYVWYLPVWDFTTNSAKVTTMGWWRTWMTLDNLETLSVASPTSFEALMSKTPPKK